MKQNELIDITYTLSNQHYENIFNVYEDSDIGYFYNLLRTINFPEELNPSVYDYYTIEPNDSWPLISWKVYKTVYLWWILCAANNIQNPMGDLIPGSQIKTLKPMYIKTILNDIKVD